MSEALRLRVAGGRGVAEYPYKILVGIRAIRRSPILLGKFALWGDIEHRRILLRPRLIGQETVLAHAILRAPDPDPVDG